MAELFKTTKQNVSDHIKHIFEDDELEENSVVKEILTTASDGKKYKTKHYNLDMIISVLIIEGRKWRMKKPDISNDFTIEDIHKIREYHDELRKTMEEEYSKHSKEKADRGIKRVEELRKKK